MNKFYCVTYKTIKVFKVSDEEMRENGYEGEITNEMREEYLDNLIDGYGYDDIEIEEMTLTKEEEKEVIEKEAYSNA